MIFNKFNNLIYSENDSIIPFHYEFKEGRITARDFAEDFIVKFYMQVVGYYTRDVSWINKTMGASMGYSINNLIDDISPIDFKNKEIIKSNLQRINRSMSNITLPYNYIHLSAAVPNDFAITAGVEEKVLQIIDEFQYLNSEIDAGEEDIPSKTYMYTAESKVAPLLVTGSLIGVLSEQLILYTPHRFEEFIVPKMDADEAIEMAMNYGKIYEQNFDRETARYIVNITNCVPGRIADLIYPKLTKPPILDINGADDALQFEVTKGTIRNDWFEYLSYAFKKYNDENMKKILFFYAKMREKCIIPER